MSNRNLMHYFSPNVTTKPTERTSPVADDVSRDNPINNPQTVAKRSRTGGSKVKPLAIDDDDDFENDSIFPPLNGNSITKYFSPVERVATTKRKPKPCKMTVEVQVHGSPKKQTARVPATKKVPKKKKRKTGLPSSLADTIELVSSEEMVTESSPSPEMEDVTPQPVEPQIETPRTKWKMKIRLEETVKPSSDDDSENSDLKDGPRRSTRLRFKPISLREEEPEEVEIQKTPSKKRKKEAKKRKVDDDVQIVSDDLVAPVFLKKKWDEEARALKKAKQEFLFSGVPEVLKQQTAVQTALEQRPVEIFPKISHITQAGSRPWHLPYPDKLSSMLRKIPLQPEIKRPTTFSPSLNTCHVDTNSSICHRSESVQQASCLEWRFCKDWITRIKEDHSQSFPFFRTLRTLLSKVNKEGGGGEDLPWTDSYAPKKSVDILANNRKPAQRLKNWLNQWKLRAGEEATLSPKKSVKKVGKRKRIASIDSDSEEAVVDDSSRDSWKPEEEELCNCVLLVGPAGCGKTATIYALAEELGYNVLEVNASSRRNGKTVLSHLHEATQSHSLNNNSAPASVANSMNKLFFRGKVADKTSRQETKTSLSLVLFEDVDIVFESEDESFYSALTTLIQTSKRPIILTLGSTEERSLALIQDKIKSHFDTLSFMSPDLSTTCGYLWCLCLTEGYPIEWKSLEKWVRSRTVINLDLRPLLLELQFLLQSHPLRLKLNFSQLQLKNDEESTNCQTGWKPSNDSSDKFPVHIIELPVTKGFQEWPYASPPKSLRFTYDVDHDTIAVVEKKGMKRFSRILSNDSPDEPDDVLEGSIAVDEVPSSRKERRCGDLIHLAHCLDLRASNELFSSCLVSDRLSWSGVNLMLDIQQFMADRCNKLLEKDLGETARSSLEHCTSEIRNDPSTRNANHVLLQSSISRTILLQREGHSADVLPYLRSFLRLDLERGVGKRRRKQRTRLESPTTRLPTLDLVMPTSSAVQLANTF